MVTSRRVGRRTKPNLTRLTRLVAPAITPPHVEPIGERRWQHSRSWCTEGLTEANNDDNGPKRRRMRRLGTIVCFFYFIFALFFILNDIYRFY